MTEPKTDFDAGFSLKDYNDLVVGAFRSGLGGTSEPAKDAKTAAGAAAMETVMYASIDGNDVAYLILIVDTGDHYHQVLTWTLKNSFSKHRATLQKVAASLKATSTP
ncbi:MAG: hypothetical protein CMJ78_24435 [Planctomycetaceae bacterium]|nr:hypothetical protein [Planctomycetaceae bacterium]